MISLNDIGLGMAKAQKAAPAPAKTETYKPFDVDLSDLADKWTLETKDEPICAACGKRIAGEDEFGDVQVPLRLFRKEDGKGLALHPECFNARVKK